jgi:uncharacterized coiled-coil protein SlyX
VSNVGETKEPKIARKGVLIALGIICIVSVACLGGVVAAYTLVMNDKNNTISSLNYQISQLNYSVADLENKVASENSTINSLTYQLTNLQNPVEVVDEQFGLQLTMALQKTKFSLGESINITLTVRNTSNQTINYTYSDPNSYFRVYNDTNNVIYDVLETQIWPDYVAFIRLNAGESLTDHYVWQQMCNVTWFSEGVPVSAGTYYIVGYGGGLQTGPILIAIA